MACSADTREKTAGEATAHKAATNGASSHGNSNSNGTNGVAALARDQANGTITTAISAVLASGDAGNAKEVVDAYRLTASEGLARIRSGSLTIEQYARSLLRRIADRDGTVKAWAYLDPEYVLREARRLDAVPMAQRGPLHGLPIAVKDVIYTKDMPTQHNSPIYKDSFPRVDAASIIILRHAGVLLLGKATTTEFAATSVGPATRNPHDPSRTPGGSSSGSGAAVADFQAPIALGTQTGGSMIRPASFNGVYALKPTWNSISREGQKVFSLMLDTLGFFARAVDDLELMAEVFNIHDDDDEEEEEEKEETSVTGATEQTTTTTIITNGNDRDVQTTTTTTPQRFTGIKGARFAVCKTMVWPSAGPGTQAALTSAASILRSHGAIVDELELPPAFADLPAWHNALLHTEGRTAFLPEHRVAKEQVADLLVGYVENRGGYTRKAQLAALDGVAALRPQIDNIAGRYAAIVAPSVPDEAPEGTGFTGSAAFCSIWSTLHTPVVNIPGFTSPNNMPIGISLVAPRYRDRHLLRVAKAVGPIFEAEGSWHTQL